MAAWSILLSNVARRDDVAFSIVVSSRNGPVDGATELVSNLLNMISLRVTVNRALSRDS